MFCNEGESGVRKACKGAQKGVVFDGDVTRRAMEGFTVRAKIPLRTRPNWS